MASPVELPDAASIASSQSEIVSSYHTPVPSRASAPSQAPTIVPQFVSRNHVVTKPGQDDLHICPYTKLYANERNPFEKDEDLTCDENVTFLSRSELLRHLNDKQLTWHKEDLPGHVFVVANRPGAAKQPVVQKLLWWNAVYDQEIILMRYLLDKLEFNINKTLEFYFQPPNNHRSLGVTALYWAAFHGNQEMVGFLLSQNADTRPFAARDLAPDNTPELVALCVGHDSTARLIAETEAKRKRESRVVAQRIDADDQRQKAMNFKTKEAILQTRQTRGLSPPLPADYFHSRYAKRNDRLTDHQPGTLNRGGAIQAQSLKRGPDSNLSDERPPSRPRSSHFDPATTTTTTTTTTAQIPLPGGRPPTPSTNFNRYMVAQLQTQQGLGSAVGGLDSLRTSDFDRDYDGLP